MASSEIELRKIAQQLDQLNKTLFHMHRTLKEIAKALENPNRLQVGTDEIPKMVEEIAGVVAEIPKKAMSEYEKMQAAIREHNDQRRYQNREE